MSVDSVAEAPSSSSPEHASFARRRTHKTPRFDGHSSRQGWLDAALLLLPLLLLSFSVVELIDDAYITARYARNLAEGNGLVFNRGERVEGMTNLLWTLVLALPLRIGVSFEQASVVLGVSFGLLALLWSRRVARRLGASLLASYCAALALALNPHYWSMVSNGLEGGLFSFLLAATVESVLARRSPRLTGLLSGLLFLTRPESGLVSVLAAIYLLVSADGTPRGATTSSFALDVGRGWLRARRVDPRGRSPRVGSIDRQTIRAALALLVVFASIAGAVTVFRLSYYGAILPNSVTAKALPAGDSAALLHNLRAGVFYLATFGWASFALAFGGLLALLFGVRSPAVWLLALVVLAEVPPVLLNGGDWMPNSRLLMVYAPLLVALLATTLDGLARATLLPDRRRFVALATLVALVLSSVGELARGRWQLPPSFKPGLPGLIACYGAVGARLATVLKADEAVAPEALGLVGYQLPGVYVHDALGLTDAWVAKHGAYRAQTGRVDYAYTYDKIHPAVVLIHQQDLSLVDLAAASAGRFQREYRAYAVAPPAPCHPYDKGLLIAVRNDVSERVLGSLADLPLTPLLSFEGPAVRVHATALPERR